MPLTERELVTAQAYANVFATPDGQRVLNDLMGTASIVPEHVVRAGFWDAVGHIMLMRSRASEPLDERKGE